MDMSLKKKKNPEIHTSPDSATQPDNTSHILNKYDILMLNNGWNDKNENLL
jgi:hypothetical protein